MIAGTMENNLLQGLNEAQKEAVIQPYGPMLVLAGAGSGKTKVLTTRILNLIQNGVSPYEILAVTFTNKAAGEMKERLAKVLGDDLVRKLWVGTFHSICVKILRQDIDKYKSEENRIWEKNFVIFSQDDSLGLIKQAIKAENMDEKIYQPKMIQAAISMAKNKGQNAWEYATRARDYRSERISMIFNQYEKLLASNNALDFDDLLLMCVKLLSENQEVLEKYHNRFKHILVDEYQDTNLTQYRLINTLYTAKKPEEELTERSLCVVGDVDQSIYSWRGADYKIILNFQKDFKKSNLIKLEQNYRSTETILEAANSIIKNNIERLEKNLYSNKGKGEKIGCFEANSEAEEANYISATIEKMAQDDKNYNKFAVLYRTNAQSRAIEESLITRGIPYKIIGGLKFYDRKEIKDAIAYLKLVYNPMDSMSLKRIINVPKRSIGPTTIKKLEALAIEKDTSMIAIIQNIEEFDDFSTKTKNSLINFYNEIVQISQKTEELPISELISWMLDFTGYIDELKQEENEEEAINRLENLQEFVNVAKDFEENYPDQDMGEFLSQIALVSDTDDIDTDAKSVTLMTLHSAKGLEFPIVFLAGLEEGIFPHSRSLEKLSEMEEERRLMYVGVTRAEEKLFLSYAKRRQMWGEYRYYSPSRFLNEIPQNLLDRKMSQSSPAQSSNTFHSAVKTLRTIPSRTMPVEEKIDYSKGFGRNFVAPQLIKKQSLTTTNAQPKKTTKINNSINTLADAKAMVEKIKQSKLKEQQSKVEYTSKTPQKQEAPKETEHTNKNFFKEGDKVFHQKFGEGEIEQIFNISNSTMYMVNFKDSGKKAMDASFAKLIKL